MRMMRSARSGLGVVDAVARIDVKSAKQHGSPGRLMRIVVKMLKWDDRRKKS
jgi:hypothetical protein